MTTTAATFEILSASDLAGLRREYRKAVDAYAQRRETPNTNQILVDLYRKLEALIIEMNDLIQSNVNYAITQIETRRAKIQAEEEKRVAKLRGE